MFGHYDLFRIFRDPSLRGFFNGTISLPFDTLRFVRNVVFSVMSFVRNLIVVGFKMSMYGPIACIMIDDLNLLDKAKDFVSRNANIRSTVLASLVFGVTITILGLLNTTIELTSLILSIVLPVVHDVVFSAFFVTTSFGAFVVYDLASSEQMRVATEWVGFNLFVVTGETVFKGTIVEMFFLLVRVIAFVSLMLVGAWIRRDIFMNALKSTQSGKLRHDTIFFTLFGCTLVLTFLWTSNFVILSLLLLAVFCLLLMPLTIWLTYYELRLVIPLPILVRLSGIGLLVATFCGLFTFSFARTAVTLDYVTPGPLANLVGSLSGCIVFYSTFVAFYQDMVLNVYTQPMSG